MTIAKNFTTVLFGIIIMLASALAAPTVTAVVPSADSAAWSDPISFSCENDFDLETVLTIDGTEYEQGTDLFNEETGIPLLAAGTYAVVCEAAGNEEYEGSSGSISYEISKYKTGAEISPRNENNTPWDVTMGAFLFGCNGNGIDSWEFSGVTVDGTNYQMGMEGASSEEALVHLSAGAHMVECVFGGDENRTEASSAVEFNVLKANSTTEVIAESSSIVYGESSSFECSNSMDFKIALTINGSEFNQLENYVLGAGEYEVKCEAQGDENHTDASSSISYLVEKADSSKAMELYVSSTRINEGERVSVAGTCPDQLSCLMRKGGETVARIDAGYFKKGTYNYIYSTEGNENYTSGELRSSVNVMAKAKKSGSSGSSYAQPAQETANITVVQADRNKTTPVVEQQVVVEQPAVEQPEAVEKPAAVEQPAAVAEDAGSRMTGLATAGFAETSSENALSIAVAMIMSGAMLVVGKAVLHLTA